MGKKILIIDDDELDRQIMNRFLAKAGYADIIMSTTGEEGLQKARSEKPDLIILDLMLPKLNGYNICRLLKFDEKYKHIPIIMCSSRNQAEDEKLGLNVGADAYFTKDSDFQVLLPKIQELLKER